VDLKVYFLQSQKTPAKLTRVYVRNIQNIPPTKNKHNESYTVAAQVAKK